MQIVATASVPSQSFKAVLAGQNCLIALYQKSTGMYFDLSLEGVPKLQGVLCHDRVQLVRQTYLGFIGDLCFLDTQGLDDPQYTGLGTRWLLAYLTPDDVASYA